VRAVLDANVFVSALLSKRGAPARLVSLWSKGELELVVSPALLRELEDIFARPRLRARIDPGEVERFMALLAADAEMVPDPEAPPPLRSSGPEDDYLLALAACGQVPLISGDQHLLALRDQAPVYSSREFLDQLERSS
jgi:putative PIN family toxin of toxin-antitoxin system